MYAVIVKNPNDTTTPGTVIRTFTDAGSAYAFADACAAALVNVSVAGGSAAALFDVVNTTYVQAAGDRVLPTGPIYIEVTRPS